MAIQFSKRIIQSNGQDEIIVFDFEPELELLGTLLYVEVDPFQSSILAAIDNVLTGTRDKAEFTGNVCSLDISLVTTRVYDNLAENGRGKWCEVDTKELKELILTWLLAQQGFEGCASKNRQRGE